MGSLVVAVGGGGDAITGAALHSVLKLTGPPVVMSYSWDRLMIDPVPGPRAAKDFTGLHQPAPHVFEVIPSTQPIAPAGSSLPRLAADLPCRLLLLDPSKGATGMADQIRAAARYFDAQDIALIDVGGDAMTTGTDPGLRSPLADQLALAACLSSDIPSRLLIAALGVDGELPADTVRDRLAALGADQLPDLTAQHLGPVRHVFNWHPSEASGLLAAAADGRRGLVEVRDSGDQISLTDSTPALFTVDLDCTTQLLPAAQLTETRFLEEAEAIIRQLTGISEIRYETDKAERIKHRRPQTPGVEHLPQIDSRALDAAQHGADYISMRRLSELLQASTLKTFAALSELLAAERPDQYEPSLFRVRPSPASRRPSFGSATYANRSH